MPSDSLNEREFELVNIVGAQLAANQRELSRQMDLSLGMTNMLLKRLVTKGYIRIKQLNQRKVEYLLTPKGFAEKMQKSVKYTLKTINSIGLIKLRLKNTLEPVFNNGHKHFIIVGHSDLAMLIEVVAKEVWQDKVSLQYVDSMPQAPTEAMVLICREDIEPVNGVESLNLIHELSKDGHF